MSLLGWPAQPRPGQILRNRSREFLAEAGAVFEVEEVKEPRKAVREAWAQSSHDIHHVGQVLRCKKCMTGVARSKLRGGADHAL
jgi:hypothetical protein